MRTDAARLVLLLLAGGVAIVASLVLAGGFGATEIGYGDVLAAYCQLLHGDCEVDAIQARIINDLRLPRAMLALLAGAGLALAGAVLQIVTRNPLADPYLFGISSGASFGAVLVIAAFGIEGMASGWSISSGAFAGAALSVLLVISLAGQGVQVERMLLAGVAVSFMFSAATSLVLYSSDPSASATLLFWTLGSFSRASWAGLLVPSVVIAAGLLVFIAYARMLQGVLAGDETANALGIDVKRLRIGMLLLSSLITAVLVAACGGIGFIGLMIPHIVRRLMPAHTAQQLIATAIFGGVFMVWVDVLARTLIAQAELPVGVITAALGSAFFLLVLRRRAWSDR
ncbi:MAG: iron ABC transporter permease [Oleiphilaceae bacterium]|nr:iron ABC transporter permease [Oleiphilaceae bacterium]